ncbi:hypothetical protein BD413DRAFT_650704 [Trametes elegans]|nr:hypothetical protein BD413DRAFT_650704 [Trametes elegans]
MPSLGDIVPGIFSISTTLPLRSVETATTAVKGVINEQIQHWCRSARLTTLKVPDLVVILIDVRLTVICTRAALSAALTAAVDLAVRVRLFILTPLAKQRAQRRRGQIHLRIRLEVVVSKLHSFGRLSGVVGRPFPEEFFILEIVFSHFTGL